MPWADAIAGATAGGAGAAGGAEAPDGNGAAADSGNRTDVALDTVSREGNVGAPVADIPAAGKTEADVARCGDKDAGGNAAFPGRTGPEGTAVMCPSHHKPRRCGVVGWG
ncbi:hypothetical protein [Microbacterium sp. ZW T5_56]|uniref:hypothetical protein n=1 Tax=Microbacterium sp. ZW T5_56 TaxID=3378081 RepID=UPI0038522B17